MNVLLLFYKYIYIYIYASSCLHFFLSGKFDPILVKSVFASATNSKAFSKHDKKYVQVWNERKNKKVRPQIRSKNIYMGIKMVERLNISIMQFINQISKPSRPRRRCMIKRKYGKTDGPRIGANFLPSPWYNNNNFQSS